MSNYLNLKGCIIRHKGMLVDNTTRVTIDMPELTANQAGILNTLVANKMVDCVITSPDLLDTEDGEDNKEVKD